MPYALITALIFALVAIGTEQVRYYKIEGNELHIEAPPQAYANFGGKVMHGVLVWKRD